MKVYSKKVGSIQMAEPYFGDKKIEEAVAAKFPESVSTLQLQKKLATELELSKMVHETALKAGAVNRRTALQSRLFLASEELAGNFYELKRISKKFVTSLTVYVSLSLKKLFLK